MMRRSLDTEEKVRMEMLVSEENPFLQLLGKGSSGTTWRRTRRRMDRNRLEERETQEQEMLFQVQEEGILFSPDLEG